MQHPATILTPQQLQAIDLFTRGQPIGCIATTVGVTRETLWRWRKLEHFDAVLQATRREKYDVLHEQAVELLRLSMLSITRELKLAEDAKYRNPLETAFKVLKFISTSGLLREAPPEIPHGDQDRSASNASLVST